MELATVDCQKHDLSRKEFKLRFKTWLFERAHILGSASESQVLRGAISMYDLIDRFDLMQLPDSTVCSNKHLIFGMDNGCVRIQPIHNDDAGLMGPYWSLSMHDNDYGAVTQLASSFDDKYLFSVGRDGNFFAFAVIDDKRTDQEASAAKVKVASSEVSD